MKLSGDYTVDVGVIDGILKSGESFDLVRRECAFAGARETFFYVEGFVAGEMMQRLMAYMAEQKKIGDAAEFAASLPAVEATTCDDADELVFAVMSGKSVMLAEPFGASALIIDSRHYPARDATEPENDRVLRGSRDGFVETLMFNIAMIRRRIRSPEMRVEYARVGASSGTDVALCFMDDRADRALLEKLRASLASIPTDSVVLGHESLAECLVRKRWYDPFPKIRLTERPDVAAASVLEGSVILLCDNSPEAMLFPTSIFDFLQEADDFYFPPVTGTYLRIIRHIVFLLSIVLVPLWYLAVINEGILPDALKFMIPDDSGDLPIIIQLFIVEFSLDGLKLAYLNTPDTLSSSVSVVGGLLLGDFAVKVGWLSPDVILYMAFASVANYTQSSYELGYAFKYLRMISLLLTALFNAWGFAASLLVAVLSVALNRTFGGKGYLYPLIPFNKTALKRLLVRVRKYD